MWAQAGPGGGYVLDAAATLPPVNLTPAQAVALAVALAAQADAPYAVDGRAALEKILDVLDPAARERTEQLAARVWVRTSSAEAPAVLAAVEEGLAQRRVLVLRYRDRLGRPSHRSPTCWPAPTTSGTSSAGVTPAAPHAGSAPTASRPPTSPLSPSPTATQPCSAPRHATPTPSSSRRSTSGTQRARRDS